MCEDVHLSIFCLISPEIRKSVVFFPDFQTLPTPIPDNISINTKMRVGHWLGDTIREKNEVLGDESAQIPLYRQARPSFARVIGRLPTA